MYIFLSVGSKVEDGQFGGFVLTCLLLSRFVLARKIRGIFQL